MLGPLHLDGDEPAGAGNDDVHFRTGLGAQIIQLAAGEVLQAFPQLDAHPCSLPRRRRRLGTESHRMGLCAVTTASHLHTLIVGHGRLALSGGRLDAGIERHAGRSYHMSAAAREQIGRLSENAEQLLKETRHLFAMLRETNEALLQQTRDFTLNIASLSRRSSEEEPA